MAGESAIVGDVGLRVNAVDPGLERQIQGIINRLEARANFNVSANTQGAQQSIAAVEQGVTNVANGWANAALQVAGFTAAINIAQGSLNRILSGFGNLFDQLAQARAGFSSILGSEAAGNNLLDDIRDFARESPFVTQELVNYSQQLLGVGKSAESIVPLLRNVGDYVASVGGDTQNLGRVLFTLTQIQSIGRLAGQDAMQLQSALIPITKLLADQLNVTTAEVKKLQEQGKISADQVFAALTEAGSRVEGAMNEATRNISGARSVLSDTIQIALQDSPELQRIFEDIVQGILRFAAALGDPEVQSNLNRFFEGVGEIYDSLKPVISSLAESGGNSAIVGLRTLSGVLETLAFVLNSIPEPVLTVIASTMATMAAIRAPLALINYVTQIQTLAGGLLGRFGSQTQQVASAQSQLATATNAANRATTQQIAAINANLGAMGAQESRIGALIKRYQGLIGAAAAYGGMILQQQTQGGRFEEAGQVAGGALTGAGIGFAVGGPIGAAAGAAIGTVTSVLNVVSKRAEEEAKRLKERAVEVAGAFFQEFDREFGDLSTRGAQGAFVEEIAATQNVVNTYQRLIDEFNQLKEIRGEGLFGAGFTTQEDADRFEQLADIIGGVKDNAAQFKAEVDALTQNPEFADWATKVQTSLGLLNKNGVDALIKNLGAAGQNPIFRSLILGERAFDPATIEADFKVLNDTLDSVGITVDQLITVPLPELIEMLQNPVPNALATAQAAFDAFNAAVKRAQEVTNVNFGPLFDQVDAIQTRIKNEKGLSDAFAELIQFDPSGIAIPVEATVARVVAAGEAITAAARTAAQQAFQETMAATGDESLAIAANVEAGNEVLAGSFAALQDTLGITDAQFKELLISAGLWDAYLQGVEGSTGTAALTLQQYADQLGVTAEQLATVLRIQGEITPETRIVVTADVTQAITELQRVQEQLATGGGSLSNAAFLEQRAAELQTIIESANVINPDLTGGSEAAINAAQAESDRIQAALFEIGRATSDDYIAYLQTRMQQETELSEEWLGLQREVTQIETDIAEERRRQEEEAQRIADEAAREAERIAKEQERAAEQWANAVESATNSLESTIAQAAEQIATAAQAWVASIKERTQYEQAVSASRLTGNANRQITDLTELTAGLASLRARGVTNEVLAALGIDNVADVRQVRRLVGSSDADLAALTTAVSERDRLALSLAKSEEDTRTRNNITAGIIEAAKQLDIDLSRSEAGAISAQFDITNTTDAESVALQLLNILTSGRVSR
jgi:tape measure domain-containing protein